jgi:GNAT superfamily N-acetyltransferase
VGEKRRKRCGSFSSSPPLLFSLCPPPLFYSPFPYDILPSTLPGGHCFVAQADIIIADEKLLPQAVDLYNSVFRPKREADFFKRRFMGRYNALTLLARMDDKPVGFWIGFELKPGMFYHWLGAVLPDVRRHGVARQLQDAQQAWAKDHGYEYIRCECMNHQREFIHFAVSLGYDLIGIRWDSTHADNLIVFEKNLIE